MRSRILSRWEFQTDLPEAIERDELLLYYQPEVSLQTGAVVGVEALLRWQRTDGRIILPGNIIPQAEEMGLLNTIGAWVLTTACHQHHNWPSFTGTELITAVNVSVSQLKEKKFPADFADILSRKGLSANRLEVEVTESALVEGQSQAFQNVCALAEQGARIAIDDFGTGYSSLDYLRRLPLHTLKFDRSFIAAIDTDPKAAAIVKGLITIAHSLDLSVIAEGVENAQQLSILHEFGCNAIQGFLISRPLPAAKLDRWMRSGSGKLPLSCKSLLELRTLSDLDTSELRDSARRAVRRAEILSGRADDTAGRGAGAQRNLDEFVN